MPPCTKATSDPTDDRPRPRIQSKNANTHPGKAAEDALSHSHAFDSFVHQLFIAFSNLGASLAFFVLFGLFAQTFSSLHHLCINFFLTWERLSNIFFVLFDLLAHTFLQLVSFVHQLFAALY